MDFKITADHLRGAIQETARATLTLKKLTCGPAGEQKDPADKIFLQPVSDVGEMAANLMLAYRHLEDARMRVGKAIQAYEGGTSCYDKKEQP